MASTQSTITLPSLAEDSSSTLKKKALKQNPQAQLSQFWSRYHSRHPARVTAIFPRRLYNGLVTEPETRGGPEVRNAAQSYEDARTRCKELVRRAVAECERTNCKFSDADFDVDQDFINKDFNCLQGLERHWFDADDDRARRTKVQPWQLQSSLGTLVKSEVFTGNKAYMDLEKLQKHVGFPFDLDLDDFHHCCAPKIPGSVHRLDWIFENPKFTIDGYSSSDVKQGTCGDCWWLAGLSSIAHRKDLMDKVCVSRDEECGVYGFVFWKDGEWIATVIDDNLYLKKRDFGLDENKHDATGRKAKLHRKEKQTGSKALFFSRCENENETWLPLLEKAYAKIHGDYEAIEGGWGGTAVEDLTGGVTTILAGNRVLRKDRLWRELLKSGEEDGEFVFALSALGAGWADTQNGITLSHAYSVLKAVEVQDQQGDRQRLVKVRNPWGEKSNKGLGEWCGPWSDGSREWTPYMIQKLDHKFGDDGNFWMSFQDLLDNFRWLHRTRLFNERWTVAQQWASSNVSWVSGYIDKKFLVEIKQAGLAVIVLSQLDQRYFKALEGQYKFTLEFMLRKAGETAPLCQVRTTHTADKRSVNCELELEPGLYEVLPKITAKRDKKAKTIGQTVKKWADRNPQKLRQIGLQYDMAHAKAGVVDEDDELEKMRGIDEKKKQKKRAKRRAKRINKAVKDINKAVSNLTGEGESDGEQSDDGGRGKKKTKSKSKKKSTPSYGLRGFVKSVQLFKSGDAASGKETAQENGASEIDTEDASSESITTPASTVNSKNEEAEACCSGSDSDSSSSESSSESEAEPDFEKEQPWDPVCVMGLRVYAQDTVAVVKLAEKKEGEEGAAVKDDGKSVAES